MKKIFTFLVFLWVSTLMLSAQTEKTILYLIPFFTNQYETSAVYSVKDEAGMNAIQSFQLMGFWAGAQIALDEFDAQGVHLNVIVKDVSESEAKLRSILENQSLMSKVNLIVGPFFSKQFTIAAQYAKKYKIPIVNPFTNRTDILQDNEYVYKLVPSLESRPAMVSFFADMYPNHQILIYADSLKKTKDLLAYTRYFNENHIAYKIVPLSASLLNNINPNKKNIVIVFDNDAARSHMISRDLIYKSNLDNIVMIVPEEWLDMPTYDVEYYSKLNIHFFSDYYVDDNNEQTKLFVHKYTEKFKTLPTLKNFGYQGYDITRFFVELLMKNMDLDRVKVEPISYRLSLDKVPNGGYENINAPFLEIQDNKIVPVGF